MTPLYKNSKVFRARFLCLFGRLDVSTGELLEVLAACAIPQLASMPPRDLANVAWAFAIQRHPHRQLLTGIAREVNKKDKARRVCGREVEGFTRKAFGPCPVPYILSYPPYHGPPYDARTIHPLHIYNVISYHKILQTSYHGTIGIVPYYPYRSIFTVGTAGYF